MHLIPSIALTASLANAAPSAAELQAAWATTHAALAAHGVAPVRLDAAVFDEVAGGGVAKRRQALSGADRVVGVAWSERPKDPLWIAILDDKHDKLVRGLVEAQLPGTRPDRKILYQHLDLPWPFADRQWVIDITNNPALWRATGGKVWERTWKPSAPSQAPNAPEDAVWVDVNDGAWLLADAAGGTLLVYQVRTSIGGSIPDDVATRWALSTLDEMMAHIEVRSVEVLGHYDAAHEPIVRPDGTPVPPL